MESSGRGSLLGSLLPFFRARGGAVITTGNVGSALFDIAIFD